jgi:tetratricopeptide (TPR) repeat protein
MVIVLDADEVLLPQSVPLVRELALRGGDVGWFVTRQNVPDGASAPAWVDHAVRLFPNRPDYRFQARVHETVDDAILAAGGRLLRSEVVLEHHLPADPVLEAKWRWYIDLLQVDLAHDPDDADRLVFLMADHYKLKQFGEATAITQRIAALRPDDFTAQFQAALCTFVHGRDALGAQDYLTAARAIRPQDPEALELAAALAASRGLAELGDVHGRHPHGPREQS